MAPMMKIPPPSRSERNAIRFPSGENAGMVSSTGESSVRLMALSPPTLFKKMSREASRGELGLSDGVGYATWRFLVKYITPIAIGLVFLNVTGILTLVTDALNL